MSDISDHEGDGERPSSKRARTEDPPVSNTSSSNAAAEAAAAAKAMSQLPDPYAPADAVEPASVPDQASHEVTPPLFVRTKNSGEFVRVLQGIKSLSDVEHVLLHFEPCGLNWHAESHALVMQCFWNKSMFNEYQCAKEEGHWVAKKSLECLLSRVSSDMKDISVTIERDMGMVCFVFRWVITTPNNQTTTMYHRVYTKSMPNDPLIPNVDFIYDIRTSSTDFSFAIKSVEKMNGLEFTHMHVSEDTMRLAALNQMQREEGSVSYDISNQTGHKFERIFHTPLLKNIVAMAHKGSELVISLSETEQGVRFTRYLDTEGEQSHYGKEDKQSHYTVFASTIE